MQVSKLQKNRTFRQLVSKEVKPMDLAKHLFNFSRRLDEVFEDFGVFPSERSQVPSHDRPSAKPKVKKRRPNPPPPRRDKKRFTLIETPSLFVKRGWTQTGNTYRGYYRTSHGAWEGEIVRRGDKFKVIIKDAPKEQLSMHPHYACIDDVGKNAVSVHLNKQPKNNDVGAIILFVETLIDESYGHCRKSPRKDSLNDIEDILRFAEPKPSPFAKDFLDLSGAILSKHQTSKGEKNGFRIKYDPFPFPFRKKV